MKNITRKLFSLLIVFIMVFGVIPPLEVLAATNTLEISQYNDKTETYSFRALIDYPTNGGRPSGIPMTTAPIAYRIYYRNISEGQTAYSDARRWSYTPTTPSSPTFSILFDLVLQPGCLYGFEIRPYYEFTSGGNFYSGEGDVIESFLVMTDLKVNAVGEGIDMEVDWIVPTLGGGAHFFQSYELDHANIVPTTKIEWTGYPETVTASGITMDSNRVNTHNYRHSHFEAGKIFAIRVVPIVPTLNLPTHEANGKRVTIDSEDFIFVSYNNMYHKTDDAYIRPNVWTETKDLNTITVNWDALDGNAVTAYISSVQVMKLVTYPDGREETDHVHTLYGDDARTISSIETTRDIGAETYYFIVVRYVGITYTDDFNMSFGPYNVTVTSIPGYYDATALEFEPYRPDIYSVENAVNPFDLTIVWKAFLRNAYEDDEITTPQYGNKYFDREVSYNIVITDNPDYFDSVPSTMTHIRDGATLPLANISITDHPYFTSSFDYYVTKNSAGQFETRAFEQNKIYYIRIVAVRNSTNQRSQPAYAAHYIIPVDRIPVEPNIIARPPLRIKTIDGIEQITDESITIEWDEQWVELYNPADGYWYSKVSIKNGALEFGDSVPNEDNILHNKRTTNSDGSLDRDVTVYELRQELQSYLAIPVLRVLDISGSDYIVHTVEYNEMGSIGYDDYHDDIISENTTQEWIDIAPIGSGTLEVTINSAQNPDVTPLEAGTPYVIFLWPYMTSSDGDKMAYYPSYIPGTTLIGRGDVDIKPVVPILEPVRVTDTTVTVRWEYLQALEYELRFSDQATAYSDGGNSIPWTDIDENGVRITEGGTLYMEYTIRNLYPLTTYYIWIRSMSTVSDEVSGWSNQVEMTTTDIEPPPPPRGLGYASEYNVNRYNAANGTDYVPYAGDYMIIEFLRITDDMNNDNQPDGSAASSNENAEFLPYPLIGETYMQKFNNLIANRTYFVRAKTRLHIVRDSEGYATRTYTYIVQLSLYSDFTDVIEIEVPSPADLSTGVYKESEWVSVALVTGTSDNEYDGDKNANTYPLPDQDWEYIYDSSTNTLTYRFRSNETGADGKRDNQVDERFISRLVINKTFMFEVDVANYGGNTINNRIIEMPVTIFSAFNERKIDLKIKAGNFTVTVPYGSMLTSEVLTMGGLDKNARVRITLAQNPANLINADTYLSEPHKLSATVTGNSSTVNITNFTKPLPMNLALSGTYNPGTTNIGAYMQDGNTGGWQWIASTFDVTTQSINFSSTKAAAYSALGLLTPSAYDGSTLNQMYRVNSHLNIVDLGVYDENATIHANQFNQIVAAILKGDPLVYMNASLSQNDLNTLGKAKLLISGSTVTREAGIAALVRLYEVKTGYPVSGYPTMIQTSYKDIANASTEYQTSLLKAAELGFFRDVTANPKGNLTMGDLMHILDSIVGY